jgi:hypothetical protein
MPASTSAPPPGLLAGIQQHAEEWIYELNERDHWIFRIYDRVNEAWAAVALRAIRQRATRLDVIVRAGETAARVRFLTPGDLPAFAALLGRFDVKYLPPHPLDAASAARALARRSYIPLGVFVDDALVGYILLRLFFFRRAVTGIWMLASTHNARIGRHTLLEAVKFLRAERIPNYCTIPIDNEPSLRIAHWCGWKIVRTNRRFHVLLQ